MTGTPGFAIALEWTGPQDKPFPAALLVSGSVPEAVDVDPWVSVAVVSRAEFDAVVAVLGPALAKGAFVGDDGYVATVRDGDARGHARLGAASAAIDVVVAMAAALDGQHQGALDGVINRLRQLSMAGSHDRPPGG